jgi:type II secretory pathway component GspD/PulD (secretin)
MTRQQQQAAQQLALAKAKKKGGVSKPKVNVYIVAIERDNSILVNAPPDKIAYIAQAIQEIDRPLKGKSLLQNMNGMRVYRLAGIDPEKLVKILERTGDLHPSTRLEVDKKNNAIIVYATSRIDHATIGMLVDKLEGSGRRFEVRRLRRLDADYVAGTIEFMMGAGEKKEENVPYWMRRGQNKKDEKDQFRVDADIVNNKLLLYANDVEMQAVTDLLVKLGEIPPEGGNSSTVRHKEVAPGKDTDDLRADSTHVALLRSESVKGGSVEKVFRRNP